MPEQLTDLLSTMADDYYHVVYPSLTKICDTGSDYGSFAERQQRFESTHSARLAGGQQDGGNIRRALVSGDGHGTTTIHETTRKVTRGGIEVAFFWSI